MAIVHKVIVLNKPFKLFGFTIYQGIALIFIALIGLWLGTVVPPVKIGGIQLGIWVSFIIVPSLAIIPVFALQIKPWPWWRNRVLTLAKLLPTEIFPQPQPANVYIEISVKLRTNCQILDLRTQNGNHNYLYDLNYKLI